jgi:hypothetical protein
MRNSVDNGGGDVSECYDVPPRAIPLIASPASSPSPAPSCYDIPRPPTSCTPNSNCSGVTPLDCYDVPRPLQPLTPSSSASSLTNDGSLSGSNRYGSFAFPRRKCNAFRVTWSDSPSMRYCGPARYEAIPEAGNLET